MWLLFFQLVVADFGFVRIDLSINLGLLPVLQQSKTSKPTSQWVKMTRVLPPLGWPDGPVRI